MFLCSICERTISRGWYCYPCYKEHQKDIEANEPWTRFVQNEEKRRRRQPVFFCLDDKYEFSNDEQIVIKNEYGWTET